MTNFQRLQTMVDEINSTTKTNEKIEILKKYPDCREFLEATYNPYKKYGVKSKSIEERKLIYNDREHAYFEDFFNLLNHLVEEKITGYEAIDTINYFIEKVAPEHRQLIYNIFDHNLKIRLDAKSINEAFPKLIPTFDVALAGDYWERADKVDFETEEWFASRKMDGLRCLVNTQTGKCYSRTGLEFPTLKLVGDAIKAGKWNRTWLDGEMCYMENGLENFVGIQSQAGRKDYIIPLENIKYCVFDYLTEREFNEELISEDTSNFKERQDTLEYDVAIFNNSLVEKVIQTKITSQSHAIKMLDEAISKGWEGLIVRKNVGYEACRTLNMLKMKRFSELEAKVISYTTNNVRVIKYLKGGKDYFKWEVVGNINEYEARDCEICWFKEAIIDYKGNEVHVGGGFSQQERIYYIKYPEDIVGKIITVQYKKESQDKTGKFSLQFPIFKCNHGDRRVM